MRSSLRFACGFALALFLIPAAYALLLERVVLADSVTKDYQPVRVADSFGTDTPVIYALVYVSDVDARATVKGVWVAVDGLQTPNSIVAQAVTELNPGDGAAEFELQKAPDEQWAPGNYKLAVYVDDILYTTQSFTIQQGVASNSTQGGPAWGAQQPPGAPWGAPQPQAPQPNPMMQGQAQMGQPPGGGILGAWQCQMGYNGQVVGYGMITFGANGQGSLNQSQFAYRVVSADRLQMQDGRGQYEYRFAVQGDGLQMQYSDGSQFVCTRSGTPQQGGPQYGMPGAPAQGGPQYGAQGGMGQQPSMAQNAWQLQGPFCHWQGSSSVYSGSSYSSTQRITFDGRGRWSYGSESSFNNQAGMGYGQGGGNSGTYEIQGRRIVYRTDAGEQGFAEVSMQQPSGAITEITLDGQLYGPALCN